MTTSSARPLAATSTVVRGTVVTALLALLLYIVAGIIIGLIVAGGSLLFG